MKELLIKIGDHNIQIHCESVSLVKMFEKNFQIINKEKNLLPDLTIKINEGFGVPFTDYKVEITKHPPYEIQYQRADYLISTDYEFKTAKILVYDELALKHAFMNLYSSFIVHHNWGLLIHSSCVVESGRAHIFAGQSGAGKSTAAKLSHPKKLLSDEASIIKITPEGVSVFNSPFRSELKCEAFEGNVELTSMQILYQALQNKRVGLEKSDALLHLIDKVFFWPQNQEEIKTILQLLTLLVRQVPVYELHFQKNNTFWELIS